MSHILRDSITEQQQREGGSSLLMGRSEVFTRFRHCRVECGVCIMGVLSLYRQISNEKHACKLVFYSCLVEGGGLLLHCGLYSFYLCVGGLNLLCSLYTFSHISIAIVAGESKVIHCSSCKLIIVSCLVVFKTPIHRDGESLECGFRIPWSKYGLISTVYVIARR